MFRKICLFWFLFFLVGLNNVYGLPFYESSDAGDSLGTAVCLVNGTTEIHGTAEFAGADLYVFSWSGGALEIKAYSDDPQLFLFDENGVGVWANDDEVSSLNARIYDPNLDSGIYFLGISSFDWDPYSVSGLIFPNQPYDQQFGPQNQDPLAYWDGSAFSQDANYVITFSVPVNAPVPEPSSVLLVGLSLFLFGFLALSLGII